MYNILTASSKKLRTAKAAGTADMAGATTMMITSHFKNVSVVTYIGSWADASSS
jgi:hypothetical protein